MKRRAMALGIAVIAVVFFISAPVVYSPIKVYNGTQLVIYPNWKSLGCWALGFGMYYGRTPSQANDSYQLGCAAIIGGRLP